MKDLEWLARNVHEWPTLNNGMECEMIYRDDAISTGWGRHWPTDTKDGSEVTRDQWLAERERLQLTGSELIPKHINCRCVMTEVKQEWKQDELPPVGTKALFVFNESDVEFSSEIDQGLKSGDEVEVLAHYSPCKDGDLVAVFAYEIEGGMLTSQAVASCFRPLRTEEEKAVEEMMSAVQKEYTATQAALIEQACRRLHQAGYRKP